MIRLAFPWPVESSVLGKLKIFGPVSWIKVTANLLTLPRLSLDKNFTCIRARKIRAWPVGLDSDGVEQRNFARQFFSQGIY